MQIKKITCITFSICYVKKELKSKNQSSELNVGKYLPIILNCFIVDLACLSLLFFLIHEIETK